MQLFFVDSFKGRVLFEVEMRDYTSLKIGGPAEVMAFPEDAADLKELLKFAYSKKFPVFVLGGGTNLLVREGGIKGIVINMDANFKEVSWQETGEGTTKVTAGSGLTLAALSKEAAGRGLTGLEFACGIPGMLGGGIVMNAGAYGSELSDIVEMIEVVDRKGKKGIVAKNDIGFGYRSSKLAEGLIVTRVHFVLKSGDRQEIKTTMDDFKARRMAKGPIKFPNAGSIFKNPEGHNAGRLIEEVGFKGKQVGGALVSEAHANYIVNSGEATAIEVLSLMAQIRDAVFSKNGIVLEPEIKVIGEDAGL